MKYLKYPNENFWDLASTYPIKVIIGPDAHDPEYVHDEKLDLRLDVKSFLEVVKSRYSTGRKKPYVKQ